MFGNAFHRYRTPLPQRTLRKNGHTINRAQRAKCLERGHTFILEPKRPHYSEKVKAQVVAAYQDRMSIRGITRTFGVYYKTILRWVGGKNQVPARLRGHTPAGSSGRRARTQ